MFLSLRTFWYTHLNKRGVREHMIREGLHLTSDLSKFSPQELSKLAENLYVNIVSLKADEISSELRDEMAARSMQILGSIPLEHCVKCNRPVFTHEATKIEGKFYCNLCGTQQQT